MLLFHIQHTTVLDTICMHRQVLCVQAAFIVVLKLLITVCPSLRMLLCIQKKKAFDA